MNRFPKIDSYSDIEAAIRKTGGKPRVLQALWDGDSDGWFIRLSLYTIKPFSRKLKEKSIGFISCGNDFRIFSGLVPPWPEAELAEKLGRWAAEKYRLEFYFPSPKEPDDDCPGWDQRHKAIHCKDCSKLIIPTGSPYLPKDICYKCNTIREHDKKIIEQEDKGKGIKMYLYRDGEYQEYGYWSDLKHIPLAPYFAKLMPEQLRADKITVVCLDHKSIRSLMPDIYQEIRKGLLECRADGSSATRNKCFTRGLTSVVFEGQKYELSLENELVGKIKLYDLLNRTLGENGQIRFYFIANINYRDDAILRFLKYCNAGSSSIKELIEHLPKILTEEAIRGTLDKLEELGCLTIENDNIEITLTGSHIV